MITKSDLEAVHRELMAETRSRVEPPSAEEMLAYTSGTLTPEQEEDVRARLLAYPELVRTLAEPFPEPAEPGDADYLSEHELARLRKRPSFNGWKAAFAVAAALAFVALGMNWWQLRMRLATPDAAEAVVLHGISRGGDGVDAVAQQKPQMLYLPVPDEGDYRNYRVEIVDSARRAVWRSGNVGRATGNAVAVFLPAHFLPSGRYEIVLYGISGPRQEELARNPVRVQ